MEQTRLLCAIGASVWWAVAVGCQTTTTDAALPETLRDHVKNERFDVVTSMRGLPLGVRDALQTLFGTQTLDIAESIADPGARPKTAASGKPTLPIRQLVVAGCSNDHHCLVYYERLGSERRWLVALFQWTPAATRFEWGGDAPGGMATIDDVRNAVVSNVVKGPVKVW